MCQKKYRESPTYTKITNAVSTTTVFGLGTIHLRSQHVLGGGRGVCPHVPMVKRSQYIRIKNPLYKHFAGMPMVGGKGSEIYI